MANNVYGYGSVPTSYSSRSTGDPFFSDAASRYLSDMPSSSYLSTYDPLRYSSTDFGSGLAGASAYSAAASRVPGGFGAAVSQPPWHASDISSTGFDPIAASVKRSREALYHQSILDAHNTVGQSEDWFSSSSLAVKRPRFGGASNLPTYAQRPGEKECPHYMLTRTCMFGDICKFNHPIWVPEGGIPEWKEAPLVVVTNESLPERPGEPDCPYFLTTQGCMFGMRCKFNHPKGKVLSTDAPTNMVQPGLPERPFDKPCAFYMKTGACKFGLNCKFDHPKDMKLPSAGTVNGNAIPNDSSKVDAPTVDLKPIVALTPVAAKPIVALTPTATKPIVALTPTLFNTKGLPLRQGEVDCPFYLKNGSCNYGAKCRYNHPEVNATSTSAAPGNAILGARAGSLNLGVVHPTVNPMLHPAVHSAVNPVLHSALHPAVNPILPPAVHPAFHPTGPIFPTIDPSFAQPTLGLGPKIYPQRPGAMECDFYMKTGVCKFDERCKFHHPINRSAPSVIQPASQQPVKLTLAGLPRREGATMCPFYLKTGTCKYGAMCRFDHPTPGEIMAKSAASVTVEGKADETA